jgi:hypothetical protein
MLLRPRVGRWRDQPWAEGCNRFAVEFESRAAEELRAPASLSDVTALRLSSS